MSYIIFETKKTSTHVNMQIKNKTNTFTSRKNFIILFIAIYIHKFLLIISVKQP